MENSSKNMTPSQYDIIKELNIICSENAFWLFMAMQSVIFDSENKTVIQNQINRFPQQWGNLFDKYYDQNDSHNFKVNVSNFFDTYIAYLNNIVNGENGLCKDLLEQWKYLANVVAQNFANVNPYWREKEWRAIINNQIDILDKEIRNNVQGNYLTLNQSYNIYNRVANDISTYVATGLINQFSI